MFFNYGRVCWWAAWAGYSNVSEETVFIRYSNGCKWRTNTRLNHHGVFLSDCLLSYQVIVLVAAIFVSTQKSAVLRCTRIHVIFTQIKIQERVFSGAFFYYCLFECTVKLVNNSFDTAGAQWKNGRHCAVWSTAVFFERL
jgi:hypothetical protein